MARSSPKNSNRSTSSRSKAGAGTAASTSATAVSPDHAARPKHIHADTPEDRSKIRHASQLLPDETPKTNDKKRLAEDAPAIVSPPANKRRRVTIERVPTGSSDDAPAAPTAPPPAPTKYLKLMLLGPDGPAKHDWINGLHPKTQEPTQDSSSNKSPYTVSYHSKDYSFQSSAAVNETVRMHLYNVDCTTESAPPASWKTTLIPSMQHVVLVLDMLDVKDAEKSLRSWKTWLERHLTGQTNKSGVPVSLLLVNNKKSQDASSDDSQAWFRLGATVEKLCRYWHINKWYMMDQGTSSSSDTILQTLIERTWTAMDKQQ